VTRGVLWLLAAELLFAIMRVATRANATSLAWPLLGSTRFLGGAVVVAFVAGVTRATLRVTDQRRAWMRSLFGFGSSMGVFFALGSPRLAVGDAATLSATAPLWVAILSRPLLGERVTRRVQLGLVLGFAGVVVLVGPSLRSAAPVALAALGGALSYAFAVIALRSLGPKEGSEAVALHVSLVCGALQGLIAAGARATGAMPLVTGPVSWWAVALAAACGGLAQIAVTSAYAHDTAARLGAVSYVGVVLSYLLEAVMLHRSPTLAQLIGAGLVIVAGVITILDRRAAAPPAVADADG
jgi:drug/metabolite transporter (DMT)-like permease